MFRHSFIYLGGIFLDMGIHEVDYLCWLVGEKPKSVIAFASANSHMAESFKNIGINMSPTL